MTMTTPSPIPEGWMLVPKAWQPIMDEIERRADKMSGDSHFTVEIDADDIESINATPSPISDQAADLLEKAALVCENMACAPQFEPEIQDRMLCAAAKSIRALSTAPTTGSAPDAAISCAATGQGVANSANAVAALSGGYASSAASVLTDAKINAIYAYARDQRLTGFRLAVRALLAASMGGDRT